MGAPTDLESSELAEATAGELAARLAASPEQRVVATLEDAAPETLRAVASRLLAQRPGAVVLLAGRTGEGLAVLIARGTDSTFGCGALLKRAAEAAGGRGGGRPEHAEGRLPPQTDWPALVASLLS